MPEYCPVLLHVLLLLLHLLLGLLSRTSLASCPAAGLGKISIGDCCSGCLQLWLQCPALLLQPAASSCCCSSAAQSNCSGWVRGADAAQLWQSGAQHAPAVGRVLSALPRLAAAGWSRHRQWRALQEWLQGQQTGAEDTRAAGGIQGLRASSGGSSAGSIVGHSQLEGGQAYANWPVLPTATHHMTCNASTCVRDTSVQQEHSCTRSNRPNCVCPGPSACGRAGHTTCHHLHVPSTSHRLG